LFWIAKAPASSYFSNFGKVEASGCTSPGALSSLCGALISNAAWKSKICNHPTAALEINAPQKDDKAPGDVQPDASTFPKLEKYDEAGALAIQNKELSNGRLAMMAIMGQLIQEGLTKQGPIEQLLVGHISPFGDGQGFF